MVSITRTLSVKGRYKGVSVSSLMYLLYIMLQNGIKTYSFLKEIWKYRTKIDKRLFDWLSAGSLEFQIQVCSDQVLPKQSVTRDNEIFGAVKTTLKRKSELTRVQTLALVWPESGKLSCPAVNSHRHSCARMEFERAEIFMRVDKSFSHDWHARLVKPHFQVKAYKDRITYFLKVIYKTDSAQLSSNECKN